MERERIYKTFGKTFPEVNEPVTNSARWRMYQARHMNKALRLKARFALADKLGRVIWIVSGETEVFKISAEVLFSQSVL